MTKQHRYGVMIEWTGNLGRGTADHRAYSRDHEIRAPGKPALTGSSDPTFRGDAARYNPEELLVASLSACHMLWYLHLCADAGIVVTGYVDHPVGTMDEDADGSGRFTRVLLRPRVNVFRDAAAGVARRLHEDAHQKCFIANSVNFPVAHEPKIAVASGL